MISVYIPNNKTRKNIKHDIEFLRKTKIKNIKKYLLKKGLIKVGTTCPNNVLRNMYEQALLSGNIKNTNPNTLIHNYMSNDTKNNNDDDEL